MYSFENLLSQYDYELPPELIANAPAEPRDSARLMVFDRKTKQIKLATFRDLPKYLPKNTLLVLNETKVIPARLTLKRENGSFIAVLFLGTTTNSVRVLSPKKLREGEQLKVPGNTEKYFTVMKREEKAWILTPSFPLTELQNLLKSKGSMPLPPYIKNTPLSETELREKYQTVFAKTEGSIAAPTASLHFTPELLKELEQQGTEIAYVTLHVHLGTFALLTEDQWKTKQLHTEEYNIPEETQRALKEAKIQGKCITAVGTTVVRTLESTCAQDGTIFQPFGTTNIFIAEGYEFKVIDALITNFHVPRSSLLMLVSAFAGREEILKCYEEAKKNKLRFYSFGDGMLIF